jgi:hypothetical protein
MKRAMAATAVIGIACAVLLTGCGGGHTRLGRPGTVGTAPAATASVADLGQPGAPAAASGGPDASITSVDTLLSQLDDQLNADSRASRDSD